jgi:hypothetical protein
MTFLQYASRRTSSKGSSDTCISDGVSTFLYRAFTAHGAHLVRVHAHFPLTAFEARFNAGTSLDCVFRSKVATDSGRTLPPILVEGCH